MWTIPYLVSVICMQEKIPSCKIAYEASSSSKRKRKLEMLLDFWKGRIKDYKEDLKKIECALDEVNKGNCLYDPSKYDPSKCIS